MSIFDDLIKIDNDGNFVYNKWIEWNHFLIPNKPERLRNIMRELLAFLGHCAIAINPKKSYLCLGMIFLFYSPHEPLSDASNTRTGKLFSFIVKYGYEPLSASPEGTV